VQTTGATASVAFGANADAAIHGVGLNTFQTLYPCNGLCCVVPKTGSAHKGVG